MFITFIVFARPFNKEIMNYTGIRFSKELSFEVLSQIYFFVKILH